MIGGTIGKMDGNRIYGRRRNERTNRILHLLRYKDKKLHKILNHIRDNEAEKSKKLLFSVLKNAKELKRVPTKLYTHNVDVDSINYSELAKIKNKEYSYQMTSRGNPVVAEILKKAV